jgi:hypothetical protein
VNLAPPGNHSKQKAGSNENTGKKASLPGNHHIFRYATHTSDLPPTGKKREGVRHQILYYTRLSSTSPETTLHYVQPHQRLHSTKFNLTNHIGSFKCTATESNSYKHIYLSILSGASSALLRPCRLAEEIPALATGTPSLRSAVVGAASAWATWG